MAQNTSEQSLSVIKTQATKMHRMLDEFQVVDNQSLALVADKIKSVKMLSKAVEEQKKKFTDPAKAIIDEAREKFDPIIKECKNAEIVLKQRAGAYMQAQEDARKKEEEKIAARVEKGTMKPETAMIKLDAMPEAKTTVRTDKGSGLRMTKRRVAFIEQPQDVPDEYWIIDEVRVRREALERDKNGEAQIPGVIIREESSMVSV